MAIIRANKIGRIRIIPEMMGTKGGSLNNCVNNMVHVAREVVVLIKNKETKERLNKIWDKYRIFLI